MYFNGSSTINSVSNITIPSIGTVSLWFKSNALDGNRRIIGSRDNFEIRTSNKTLIEDFCTASGLTLSTSITVDTLYHVLVRYDRSLLGNGDAWLNGTLVNSGIGHISIPGNALLTIGNRTGAANGDRFMGYIDDIRIYNRWLSNNEVLDIYYSRGSDFNVYGLLNRWLLLENAPNVAVSGVSGSVKDFMGNLNCSLAAGTPLYSESMIKVRTKKPYKII